MWASQTQIANLSQVSNRRQPATLTNQNALEDYPRYGFCPIPSVAALAGDLTHDSAHVQQVHHQHDEDAGIDSDSRDRSDRVDLNQGSGVCLV